MSPTNSEHENDVSRSRSASENGSDSPKYLNDSNELMKSTYLLNDGSEQTNKSRSPSPAHDTYVVSQVYGENRIRSPSPSHDTYVESQVYGENQIKSPSPVHSQRSKSGSRSPTPNEDRAKSQSRSLSKGPSPDRKSRSRTPRSPRSRSGKKIVLLLFIIFSELNANKMAK